MLSLSICTDITKNINPLLLVFIITLDISGQVTIYDFIDRSDFININEGKCNLLKIEFSVKNEAVI